MKRSEVRAIVFGIWRDVLESDSFGDTEDFIAVGGDSLLSEELLTRLIEAFPEAGFDEVANFDWLTVDTTVNFVMRQAESS